MEVQIVILAAGQGSRMNSMLAKVLHPLAGKSLLSHVIDTASLVSSLPPIVVIGHAAEQVKASIQNNVFWCEQKEQLGTAHAVQVALSKVNEASHLLILYGDVPLISAQTLEKLIAQTPQTGIGIVVTRLANPKGYGRVKRAASDHVQAIVEEADATDEERNINEINSGIYLFPIDYLRTILPKLNQRNQQKEYYLTDCISHAVAEGKTIVTINAGVPEEVLGVNDRRQLAELERFYQKQIAEKLMASGVTIYDPSRFDARGELHIEKDVVIDINVIFEGRVKVGENCHIGANCVLRDVFLEADVEVKANSIIEGAHIAAGCVIGPFARIRPGTILKPGVHIGNFVEIKNSDIGMHSKINHLSYVGDSEVGKAVNVGAGTITCNYDGANKHKTIICDNTHIGSDTQLVAPVKVGEGATIAAGSTITKDVPAYSLTLTHRIEQRIIKDWQRPVKKE